MGLMYLFHVSSCSGGKSYLETMWGSWDQSWIEYGTDSRSVGTWTWDLEDAESL